MPEDKNKVETAPAQADAVITTLEEARNARRPPLQGFRGALRNLAIRMGLSFLLSQRK
jgi:hypothetical protein